MPIRKNESKALKTALQIDVDASPNKSYQIAYIIAFLHNCIALYAIDNSRGRKWLKIQIANTNQLFWYCIRETKYSI